MKKIMISLIVLIFIIFAIPIKGSFSLTSSLSNSTVNQFTFVTESEIVDNNTNDEISQNDISDDITDTKVNEAQTGDDTHTNLLLIGLLISVGGLAYCWIKENKQSNKDEK